MLNPNTEENQAKINVSLRSTHLRLGYAQPLVKELLMLGVACWAQVNGLSSEARASLEEKPQTIERQYIF